MMCSQHCPQTSAKQYAQNLLKLYRTDEIKRVAAIATPDRRNFTFRGAALKLQTWRGGEVIISGPAETGKTVGALHYLHCLMLEYPGAQAAIVRKRQVDMPGTCLQTYEKKVLPEGAVDSGLVRILGATKPERYIYRNSSTIWVGGMDNPGKVLSGERDFILVNQGEELELKDWETLGTRATGRAGNAPFALLFGDCNPPHSIKFWTFERRDAGALQVWHSYHTDNPLLFDDAGSVTEQGEKTLGVLSSLTGSRRARLFEGKPGGVEGAVYDGFSYEIHVKTRPPEEMKRWYLALDEGYSNPAVILLIGVDSDKRVHIAREFYERGKLQSEVVSTARDWYDEFGVKQAIVDSAAAGLIADLRNNGVRAIGGKGRVLDGIHLAQDLLKDQGDKRPRLAVDAACVNTINEFESYQWKPGKDEPVKENDHAMDALRYFAHKILRKRSGGRGT